MKLYQVSITRQMPEVKGQAIQQVELYIVRAENNTEAMDKAWTRFKKTGYDFGGQWKEASVVHLGSGLDLTDEQYLD